MNPILEQTETRSNMREVQEFRPIQAYDLLNQFVTFVNLRQLEISLVGKGVNALITTIPREWYPSAAYVAIYLEAFASKVLPGGVLGIIADEDVIHHDVLPKLKRRLELVTIARLADSGKVAAVFKLTSKLVVKSEDSSLLDITDTFENINELIATVTTPAGVILDPFRRASSIVGSAYRMDRKAIALDIDLYDVPSEVSAEVARWL